MDMDDGYKRQQKNPPGGSPSKRLYKDERKAHGRTRFLLDLFGIGILVLVIVFSNLYYTRSAAKYTKAQVTESMTQVSVSMARAFSDRVAAWYDELDVVGQFISQKQFDPEDGRRLEDVYDDLSKIRFSMFDHVGLLTEDGYLILSSGTYYDAKNDSAVTYFLENKPAHSCMVTEIEQLRNSFVFVIPHEDGKSVDKHPIVGIIGTVNKQEVAELLTTDAFGVNYAYVVISDDEGNVVVDTESKRRFGDNLLETFKLFASPETIERLSENLKNGTSETMELMGVTEKFLMYYTPIESMDSDISAGYQGAVSNWRLMILTSSSALNQHIAGFSERSQTLLYIVLAFTSVLLLIMSVISAHKSRKLLIKNSVDSLTGLLNAERFRADANYLLRSDRERYAVISMDIARFKMINSKYGHRRADRILVEVANQLESFLRHDEIAARMYSDRFAVLLHMKTEQGRERLRLMKQHVENASYSCPCRIELNVGVYCIRSGDKDVIVPLDYARYARTSVKTEGCNLENIAYYDDAAFERHKKEMQLTEMASAALANHEFVVHYQLKRGIGASDDWVGCEALVRWENKQYGFLFPGVFIDLFEKNGFIIKLDHYVFETVCRDLRRSMDEGKRVVPVSFNLSKRHFEEHACLDDYETILQTYRIPRELIEFEITETLAASNASLVHSAIEKIHEMGCRCALDDFGKGYSSFDMVLNFSLDTIKLDASLFCDDLEQNPSRRIIISTLIDLSHRLGMRVVAEGIETASQAKFLAEKNCDAIQGYYYAKPAPYADCRKRLDQEDA